ncbi:MAG TPA: hypothetical protein VGH34_23330 [Vicinamibacterales bacterium]|jgi:hypothetical protein
MRRGSDISLGATTSGVVLASGAALALIVYALLTFIAMFPSSSAQILARLP